MTIDRDRDYYARRARDERAAAMRALDPAVKIVHERLARAYRAASGETEAAD